MGSADLHTHTRYSDGTMTPLEIADRATEKGVSLLAIADHDMVDGSIELEPLCAARGIRYVPAVEHSALFDGGYYHVLGYGTNLRDSNYRALVKRAREALLQMSFDLIERMEKDEPRVSLADFSAFERDPSLGGWAGIEYLMKRGVTESMTAGMPYYQRYHVLYADADFPSIQETIDAIHAVGGVAVLAHPGEVIAGSGRRGGAEDREAFMRTLDSLLDQGLDGIECYYPCHCEWVRDACLARCRARGLSITAGSDCHGTFQDTDVGEMGIPEAWVTV